MSLTRDELESSLPPHLKSQATQALVDRINTSLADPIAAEAYRNNIVSYTMILTEGRFKLKDYFNAVMYVTFKALGKSNKDAYALTFPVRMRNLTHSGTSDKDIASYVAAYNRGQLVQKIMEQTLTPVWVLNHGMYQETLNEMYQIVKHGKSEMAKVQAGNAILNAIKPPEKKEINVNVGITKSDGLRALEDSMAELARRQIEAIESGVSAREVAEMPLIEGTAREIVQ